MPNKLVLILIVILSFLAGSFLLPIEKEIQLAPVSAAEDKAWRTPEEEKTISVYKSTNDAVVFISTVTFTIDPFDWFPEVQPQKSRFP